MHVVFLGRVTPSMLARKFAFDHAFPDVKWGFPLGSEIVLGLVRRGHRVSVITSDHRYKETQVFRSGSCDVYIVPEQGGFIRNFTFFRREVSTIAALVRSLKPDVVFAQWTYQNAEAGIKSGYPTLVVAHDSPWRVFRTFRNLQTFIKAMYATLFVMPKVRHITAVSPYIVREFKKFKMLRNVDIPVIPNGIEIGDEDSRVERVEGMGNKTIICISQKGRLKNSGALFKAWEMLRPRHSNWRLKVYGQGMPEGQVHRTEIDRVLREEADLFVSPSLEESFGMVFVEAMRFGVPCIGGEESGAVPWVLGVEEESRSRTRDNDSCLQGGVVCDVMKPEKLAECIERVMGDAELRRRLCEGGRRRVKEMFDIEKVVDLYEAELKRVAAEG